MTSRRDSGRDLESFEDALSSTLERLGLGSVALMKGLAEEWEELAGAAWAGISRPIVVRDRELVVEVDPPSAVRVVAYDTARLLREINGRFGEGAVAEVKVVAKRPS